MIKTMNIGIDHGYYAIKTRHFSFPAGITAYSHEPYTLQNTLEYGGKFFVCGTGRQPILRNKMENENYYLLTLAAIAKEIQQRGAKTECSVTIAAGLPLAGFGREKKSFREYLRPSSQPVSFKFEGVPYKVTIEDVKLRAFWKAGTPMGAHRPGQDPPGDGNLRQRKEHSHARSEQRADRRRQADDCHRVFAPVSPP